VSAGLLVASACGGEPPALEPGQARCELELSKTVVNFGIVEVNRTGVRPIEVRNVGEGLCPGISVQLVYEQPGLEPPLQFAGGEAVEEVTIEPGAALHVPVFWSSTRPVEDPLLAIVEVRQGGALVGRVRFLGRTPTEPFVLVVPNSLYFCGSDTKTATLLNAGPVSWEVAEARSTGAFDVEPPLRGAVLEPSETRSFEVRADFGRALGGGRLDIEIASADDTAEATLEVVFLDCAD